MTDCINTIRGPIAISHGLVSLTDIWQQSGQLKQGNHPKQWCEMHNVTWHGDEDCMFASVEVAKAYAWQVSPCLGGTLDDALREHQQASPFEYYGAERLQATAKKSHKAFVEALMHVGVSSSVEIARLTNTLYQSVLGTSARSLYHVHSVEGGASVRSQLDTKSLASVMTVEVNLAAALFADQQLSVAEIEHQIKQHASLVALMYHNKSSMH